MVQTLLVDVDLIMLDLKIIKFVNGVVQIKPSTQMAATFNKKLAYLGLRNFFLYVFFIKLQKKIKVCQDILLGNLGVIHIVLGNFIILFNKNKNIFFTKNIFRGAWQCTNKYPSA